MNQLNELLEVIQKNPESITFQTVIETIDNTYNFTPTGFKNGYTFNEENQNNGSCKVFAFAALHNLSANNTLHLFGDFYRKDVLENPTNEDHQNIRNFIKFGWSGIQFEGEVLVPKL